MVICLHIFFFFFLVFDVISLLFQSKFSKLANIQSFNFEALFIFFVLMIETYHWCHCQTKKDRNPTHIWGFYFLGVVFFRGHLLRIGEKTWMFRKLPCRAIYTCVSQSDQMGLLPDNVAIFDLSDFENFRTFKIRSFPKLGSRSRFFSDHLRK